MVFGTFRGGFILLSTAYDRETEGLRDAIKPIYEPRFAPAEGIEWLRDGDLVIGYTSKSGARAYPVRMLNLHEIVNDLIDGERVVVIGRTRGPTGVAFLSSADDRALSFRLDAGFLEDLETGSRWDDDGVAVSGPLAGARLSPLPLRSSFWFSLAGALPGIDLYKP